MFLTLEKFLEHFNHVILNNVRYDNPKDITKETFVKSLIITYKGNPTLYELFNFREQYACKETPSTNKMYSSVIKNENDKRYIMREEIIDYLYDIIILNRFKYLEAFYNAYFTFESPSSMKWAGDKDEVNIWVNSINNHDNHTNNNSNNDNISLNYLESSEFNNAFLKYNNDYDEESYKNMLIVFNKYLDGELNAISMQKNDNSRRIVRNINYLDILHLTKVTNTCKSKTSFWESLVHVYTKLILADRFFAPSCIALFFEKKNQKGEINYNNFFYQFQQYQPKASILNPYTINWLFKYFLNGKKLFTPVLSWSTYIISYTYSNFEEYVGVDVMPQVCEKCNYLFKYLKEEASTHNPKRVIKGSDPVIYCKPSESLLDDKVFMDKYKEYFDTIIFCPPYFDMEIYNEGEQSIKNYPKYETWLKEYWENTIALCYHTLQIGGKIAFVVNDYNSLKGQYYPLINDFNIICLKYFKLINTFQLVNRGSPLRMNFKNRTEMLFIYQKYD